MTIPPEMERWRESKKRRRIETAQELGISEGEAALNELSPTLLGVFDEVRFHHTLSTHVFGKKDFRFTADLLAEVYDGEGEAYGLLQELELVELVDQGEDGLWRVSVLGQEAIYHSSE